MTSTSIFGVTLLCALCLCVPQARAFKAAVGDGSDTFLVTAPAGRDPYPFENVVRVNGASGVYLGGGWVLTAEHVGFASQVIVRGITYAASDAAMRLDLTNPDGVDADLILFRLDYSSPDDPNLALTISGLDEGDSIFMAGFGGSGSRSWATNVIEHIPNDNPPIDYTNVAVGTASYYTLSVYSAYDLGIADDGQGVGGDSGGGVFIQNGSDWELGGIAFAIDTSGDPDLTYYADLDIYRSSINSFMLSNGDAPTLIPEPGSVVLLGVAAGLGCSLGRRRRRAT